MAVFLALAVSSPAMYRIDAAPANPPTTNAQTAIRRIGFVPKQLTRRVVQMGKLMTDKAEEVLEALRSEGKARKRPADKVLESEKRIDGEMSRFVADFHQKQSKSLLEASRHFLTD